MVRHDAEETTWANVSATSAIVEFQAANPRMDTVEMWCLQRQWRDATLGENAVVKLPAIKINMLDRVRWIVDPERFVDLNQNVMTEFRRTAAANKNPQDNPALAHLPKNRLTDLAEIRTRKPGEPGRWNSRLVDPDQVAVIFHLARLGASFRACQTFFAEHLDAYPVNTTRMIISEIPRTGRPGWNWPS